MFFCTKIWQKIIQGYHFTPIFICFRLVDYDPTSKLMKTIAVTMLCIFCLTGLPRPVFARVQEWQKGVSFYPRSSVDFGSEKMQQVLKQVSADYANFVTLVIPYYQQDVHSTTMYAGYDTPTDESLVRAIDWAHDLNMAVMIKPHLDSGDGDWRANIVPKNRDEWFANYENLLMHYVNLANQTGAEEICVGTELINLSSASINLDNTARWEKIIADIRAVYPGLLTYSANWGAGEFQFCQRERSY